MSHGKFFGSRRVPRLPTASRSTTKIPATYAGYARYAANARHSAGCSVARGGHWPWPPPSVSGCACSAGGPGLAGGTCWAAWLPIGQIADPVSQLRILRSADAVAAVRRRRLDEIRDRAVALRAPGAAQRERRCLPLTYANLPLRRILFRITAIPLADRAVPVVDLSRRVGRLNRRERLEDLVSVPGVPGNDPRVARLQKDHLSLAVQLGASRDHIAHRLVIPCDLRHRRTRRPVAPQPHPHADPRRQVHLAQRAVRRVRAVDLDDCLVAHGAIEPATGCPHKKRRGTAAGRHRVGARGPVRLAGSPLTATGRKDRLQRLHRRAPRQRPGAVVHTSR